MKIILKILIRLVINYKNQNLSMNLLRNKITETYEKNGFVNINEIESTINPNKPWQKNYNKKYEINLGFQIENKYVLRCMMTLTSIMSSQKLTTKIRFHFSVVLGFSLENMLKIYSLRSLIREDVEFNFYNAKRVETDLKGLNTKGPGAVSKLLLPELLPDDIQRLFVLDTGDLLVINDLSEAYNWDLNGCLYAGVPAGNVGSLAKITNKIFDIYISIGTFLIDVKKVKEEKMYEKFVNHKKYYRSHQGDQDLLNDVAFGRITYLPFKYGMISPFEKDKDSELAKSENLYSSYTKKLRLQEQFPFLPKDETEFLRMGYGPYIIHHCHFKWMHGKDLTVYRRLAQYYIKMAGISNEICEEFPGYCK